MICSNCSHANHASAKFCEECGQPLQRLCPSCGASNSVEAKYCSNCGEPLVTQAALDKVPAAVVQDTTRQRLATLQNRAPLALKKKIRLAHGQIEGERKPVTILFTDIVGSTSLAEKLDIEEWHEIVNGAHQLVSQAVYQYEGTIAQLLGDGVLAFFGAPITHEDDPIRAMQAALYIQKTIQAYAATLPGSVPDFKMRIGINTGTVVVGNIGHDLHMEYLAIGDAVNLAARLQSAAEPGKILISQATAHLVQHAVQLEDLGEIALKGKHEAVHIYQVLRLQEIQGHGRKMEAGKNLLVGRQAELSALLKASSAVQAGLGSVVVLIGEPGLGKSRLVSEWRQQESGNLRWITGECLSYGEGLAFHLVISMLHGLLGLPDSASEFQTQQALSRLTDDLLGEENGESYAFLAHLLSLPLPEQVSRFVQGLNPQGFQVQYLATLRRLLLALAKRAPLGLIFEDVHWADPSSVEMISKLLPLAQEAPVLFCFTSRPEQSVPGWGLVTAGRAVMGGGLVEITLQPLASTEVQELAANLLDIELLPEAVQKIILEKAEGNPLFVEELVSILVEKGILERQAGTLLVSGDLAAFSLPENLMRLILARIDRLPEEPKRTLRVASVIGRQFLVHTLEDVLKRVGQAESQPHMLSQLRTLEFFSLIQLAATRPEIAYLFRHALVQEAAYEAILKADRRLLHQATAEAMEIAYPDRLDELAPTLAYHFARAEARQKALYYLTRAAERANGTYANTEAIALYRAAIDQAKSLFHDEQAGMDTLQIVELQMKLGDILLRVGQHEAGRAAYEEGLARLPESQLTWRARLLDRIGNTWLVTRQIDQALESFKSAETVLGYTPGASDSDRFTQWLDLQMDSFGAYYWTNDVPSMNTIIERLEPVLERSGTAVQRANYYFRLVNMEYRRDRYWPDDLSFKHAQQCVAASKESGELEIIGLATFELGFCHMFRMEFDQAESFLKESLALCERIGDMEKIVLCNSYLTLTYRRKKALEAVKDWASRSLAVACEANMSLYQAVALANKSWVSFMEADLEQAEEFARQAQATFRKTPVYPVLSVYIWPLLAISLHKNQLDQAAELAEVLIHPGQHRIPEKLEAELRSSIDLYKGGKWEQSKAGFETAVQMAMDTGYF